MATDSRIERIDDAVIKLEKDMAVMTSSITTLSTSVNKMSGSIEDLVKLYGDQKLLKQEVEYVKESFKTELAESKNCRIQLWKDIVEVRERCISLEKDVLGNTFFAKHATKFGWLIVAGGVSFIFYMIRNFG